MKKILIVDDQPITRELVEVTLRANDYEILQASNGQEAIDLARSAMPDLIILDIMMPGDIDGFDVCQTLKGDDATSGILIIMLTAKGQDYDKEKGAAVGADDYFVKPFSPLDLLNKIEDVLE